MTRDAAPPAVEMRGITKHFGEVVANAGVDFAARSGEVHALVGENGAGKSTLMSVLTGLYRPDTGTVAIDGRPVRFRSPRDAIDAGIGMVHQHFTLVDSLTVAENVLLGRQGQGFRLDTSTVERELDALGERHGLRVDPRARIWQLSVGEQQRVEILRVLHRGARILILDEPTAVLTPREAAGLAAALRGLADEGLCVVFISHKLDEVLALADQVTVLRRGRSVGTVDAAATDRRSLARLMVGRELLPEDRRLTPTAGTPARETVLEVVGLRAEGDRGRPALDGVDLRVGAGESLGIAGVAGNGQRELAEVVTGLRRATAGRVVIGGQDLTNRSPRAVAAAGVAHIPEDRLATGLVGGLDLAANAILRGYRVRPLTRGPLLAGRAIARFTDRLLDANDVQAPGRSTPAGRLSGGNQQKLLLGRELDGRPRLVVAVHPARGVDVGATETIHRLLREQRAAGAATLLISEDLDELLALSDRIAVLFEGRVVGEVESATADHEQLGLLMAGVTGQPGTERAGFDGVPIGLAADG